MKITWGNYQFRDNEVTMATFSVRPKYNSRRRKESVVYQAHLHGEILINDTGVTSAAQLQAAQHARISEIVDAFADNGKDLLFLHDDGTPTRHSLISNDSISGTQVMHRSWPKGDQDEYATCRTFYIIIQAEYLESETQLSEYFETLRFVSTGGPRVVAIDTAYGPPILQTVNLRTHQQVIQSGRAVGLTGYPLPYAIPIFPDYEHVDRRDVIVGTPQHNANGFTHYPLQWTFYFSLPTGVSAVPIPR